MPTGRGRPHGETCLTSRRKRHTATPSWWSGCRSWWLWSGSAVVVGGGVVVVQGCAGGRERVGRDPPLPPSFSGPPVRGLACQFPGL